MRPMTGDKRVVGKSQPDADIVALVAALPSPRRRAGPPHDPTSDPPARQEIVL
jgi:hypothetical protein